MKRTAAIVLCFCMLLGAACGCGAQRTMSDQAAAPAGAETAAEFVCAGLPAADEQLSIEELPDSAEEFLRDFRWSYGADDYDCGTCADAEKVLLMLIGDMAFADFDRYPVESPQRYEQDELDSIDPRGYFDPVSAVWYEVYSREAVEWAAVNVLNLQPEIADAFPEEGRYYYLYEDMYRVEKGDMGMEAEASITSAYRTGEIYHISFSYEPFPGEEPELLEAVLEYKTEDGASWWSVYSMHEQPSADAAMKAYRGTLEEMLASAAGYSFMFAYLDGDEIPELIVDTAADHARIIIFIFVDGNVVQLTRAGQGTEFRYVPGKNLFCISDTADDGETVTYYRISDGSFETVCTLHSDSSGYTVDQVPVSETEYEQQRAVFETEVWVILVVADDGYALTAENIAAALAEYGYTDAIGQEAAALPDEGTDADAEQPQAETQEPFYGIWVSASKSEAEMQALAEDLAARGYNAQVFVTTDWSNLNTETWYVTAAGVYPSEEEAQAALADVQANVTADAYIKYSGTRQE